MWKYNSSVLSKSEGSIYADEKTSLDYFLSITQELSDRGENLLGWQFTAFALEFSLYSVFLDCLACSI